MSIFGKILEKIGLKKDDEEAQTKAKSGPVKRYPASSKAGSARTSKVGEGLFDERETPKAPMKMVDVRSKLESMAEGTNLDWKASIVDLLKVLDIDSSLEARKELARELDCPPELIGGDYAKMNTWLHKKVMEKIAENGGKVPKELLD